MLLKIKKPLPHLHANGKKETVSIKLFRFPYAGIIQIRLQGCNLSPILIKNRIVAPLQLI